MATKLYIEADVSKLINGIDKAADSIEDFGSRGEDAIKDLNKSFASMSEKQKRSFEASKKSFDERIKKIKELEAEYEVLRRKQANNGKLNDEEIKRLRQISKEYKDCKGSLATSSRELTNMAKRFREAGNSSDKLAKNMGKVVSAENKIKTKTPQVTHQFTELKTETLALVAAIGLSADALVSMGVEADRQLAKLNAMVGSTEVAKRAYYEMADAQRYLGIEADIFEEYYSKLTKVTGSAKTAAYHLKLMGDAAAHAGMRDQQLDQMIDQLEIIQANGFFTDTNIELLEEVGLTGVKKALEDAFNVPYEQISKNRGQEVYAEIIKWFEKAFAGTREIQNDSITGIFSKIAHDVGQIALEIGKIFLDDLGIRDFFKSFSEGSRNFVNDLRKMNSGVISFREVLNNTFGESVTDAGYWSLFGAGAYGVVEAGTSIGSLFATLKGQKKIADESFKAGEKIAAGLSKVDDEASKANKAKKLEFLVSGYRNSLKNLAATKTLETIAAEAASTREELDDLYRKYNNQDKGWDIGDQIHKEGAIDKLRYLEDEREAHLRLRQTVKEYEEAVKEAAEETAKAYGTDAKFTIAADVAENIGLLKNESATSINALDTTAKAVDNASDAVEAAGTVIENSSKKTTRNFNSVAKSAKTVKASMTEIGAATNKKLKSVGFFAGLTESFAAIAATSKTTFAAITATAKACFAAILTPITGITIALAALAALADRLYDKYKDSDYSSLLEHAMRGQELPESEAVQAAVEGLKIKQKQVETQKTLNKLTYYSQGLMDAHNKELQKDINRRNHIKKVTAEQRKEQQELLKKSIQFNKDNLARDQYSENYSIALAAQANEEKLAKDIEYYANLETLMKNFGADEKSLEAQRVKNKKQAAKDLLDIETNYAAQLKSLQDRLTLKNLDLQGASTGEEKSLIEKDILQIEDEIANLNFKHPNNILEVEIRANVNQLTTDLQEAVRKVEEKNEGLKVNPKYHQNLGNTLSTFQEQAKNLSQAFVTGDMEGVLTVGQLLGMTEEEIYSKGATIQEVFNTISAALIDSSSKQVAADKEALKSAQDLAKFRQNYMNGLAQGFGDMFADWASGAKSAKDAFGDFARTVVQEALAMIAKLTALYLLMLACGYGGKAFANAKFLTFGTGSWQGKADGGLIIGPGTSRSDSIPTMLSNGEYVINAAAVRAIGVNNLDQLNKGYVPRFADGGLVGKSNASQPAVAPNINLTVSALDASSFDNFLRRGGLDKIKQAFYSDNLKFASNAGVF